MPQLNPNQVNGLVNENFILNPSFIQIQRGAFKDNPTVDYHSVDAWRVARESYAGNCRIGRSSTEPPNASSCLYCRRNSGDSSGAAFVILQQIETYRMKGLKGHKLTLSFHVTNDANFDTQWNGGTVKILSGTAVNESIDTQGYSLTGEVELLNETITKPAVVGTFTKYEFTTDVIVPTNAESIVVAFTFDVTGTAAADAVVRLGQVKLEIGEFATPYIEPDRVVDLQKCMRYYQNNLGGTQSQPIFSGDVTSGQSYFVFVPLLPQMYGTPSVSGTLAGSSSFNAATFALNIDSDTGFRATCDANGTGRGFFRFTWEAESSF